nr:helix-turn-helix domain-containing protein [Pseudomonas sp. UBA6718]
MHNHARLAAIGLTPDDLMTPEQVAAALLLSIRTLAAWRSSGRNPLAYLKVGGRVRYRRSDVDAWLESQSRTSTAAAVEGAA